LLRLLTDNELQAKHPELVCPRATQQLTIGPLADTDQWLFEELYCNTTTMQNIATPYSAEQIPAMFQRCRKADQKTASERRFYTLKSTSDQSAIGLISRVTTGFSQAPAELGIMLLASARGTGCADEALASLCLFCLEQLQMPAVMVRCHPQNKGACQLNIRLGFTAAPAELQDHSGLLCWWMPNTPKQQAHLIHICAGLRSNQLPREVF
jgi:RimJ/RimL family protein N-acetyltransferase